MSDSSKIPPGGGGSGLPGMPSPSEEAARKAGLGKADPFDHNPADPAGYAHGKVHSGASMTGARVSVALG